MPDEVSFKTDAVSSHSPVSMHDVLAVLRAVPGADEVQMELAENAFARASKRQFHDLVGVSGVATEARSGVPGPDERSGPVHFVHSSVTMNVEREDQHLAGDLLTWEVARLFRMVTSRTEFGHPINAPKVVFFGALECALRKVGDYEYTFAWKQRFGFAPR